MLKFIKAYLKGRQQHVVIGGHKSSMFRTFQIYFSFQYSAHYFPPNFVLFFLWPAPFARKIYLNAPALPLHFKQVNSYRTYLCAWFSDILAREYVVFVVLTLRYFDVLAWHTLPNEFQKRLKYLPMIYLNIGYNHKFYNARTMSSIYFHSSLMQVIKTLYIYSSDQRY